jgi:hypothetical protein
MKRIAWIILSIVAATAYADVKPSERLMQWVLADYFTRYFCITKFPKLTSEIQRAFDTSRFRYFHVPCRGLKCSNAEYSQRMEALLEKAKSTPISEELQACSSYRARLEAVELELADELDALYPPPIKHN